MKNENGALRLWVGTLSAMMALMIANGALAADLKTPRIFSDNMVLQRNCQVPVWGWASPSMKISVGFDGQDFSAVADADGKWLVKLSPMQASTTARTLLIMDEQGNRIEYRNILVGDVWIASGQSNMELNFGSVARVPSDSSSANIRLTGGMGNNINISPEPGGNRFPVRTWQECSPRELVACSIAGYYFAKELQKNIHVPIGIINMAVGCSSIESWMPPDAFKSHETWKPELDEIKKMRELFQRKDGLSDSDKLQFIRDHAVTKYGRIPAVSFMKNGEPMLDKFNYVFWHALVVRPSNLYFHAVEPVIPFAIRGVIWYQGETNFLDQEYAEKQRALIESWRKMWGLGDFPFYMVQIAPYRYYAKLADLWMQQYKTAREVKNTGIIPTVDISELDNCHPANKRDVGQRLAAIAMRDTYGSSEMVASGPIYRSQEIVEGKIIIHFSQTHGGLRTRDGKPPDWFEIAGKDGKFVKANAMIAGDNVEVSSPGIPLPMHVRCGWSQIAEPNLCNSAGWPVWPFNTSLHFFSENRKSYDTP